MKKNSLYYSVFKEDEETRRNCSRLSYAIESNDLIRARKLLCETPELVHIPYGADRQVPLEKAIITGNLDVCEVIAQFGSDIDHVDEHSGDTLAHLAARQRRVDILQWLVGLNAPLDFVNSDGFSPLMECVDNVDAECATLLLTAGADSTTKRARTGFTALHMAISGCSAAQETFTYRHLALIRLLITWMPKQALDTESVDRDTPLLTAVRNGNFTVAKWLLDAGASPNTADRHGYNALLVVLHSYHDFVKTKKAKDEHKVKTISFHDEQPPPLEGNEQEVVLSLKPDSQTEFEIVEADALIACMLEKGADLTRCNNRGETALHLAVGNNLVEIAVDIARRVRGIPSVLCHLNLSGHSVLHTIAQANHDQKSMLSILSFLLDPSPGTEVIDFRGKDDTTALFTAMYNKKLDLAKYFVEKGADVKCICNGETLLHAACRSRKLDVVLFALEQGIDVNAINRDTQSAAHIAATCCNKDVMIALISAGADVNLPTKPDKYTPFYVAVRAGHLELVEVMLPKAKLDQLTAYGETAMAEAARSGDLPIVSTLIAACANQFTPDGKRLIDLYASRGKPPLVAASERGHRNVVEVLIKNGANPNLVILDGTSALYAAIGQCQIATVRYLLAWGADLTAVNRCGPRLCCFSFIDPHPHLELSPFFCAAKFQNLNLAKLCARFYSVPPFTLVSDIITVVTSASDEDEARWSPLFLASFLEFLTSYIHAEPTSLQHQCRMKIRSILGSPLPLKIAFLPVPVNVKDYLLMRGELTEGAADDPALPNPPPPPNT